MPDVRSSQVVAWHHMWCGSDYDRVVAGRPGTGETRARGSIETLRSGALRVRVYAGVDPLTGKRHYATEVVPAGPRAKRDAEAVRARLVQTVAERRSPRTN